MKNRLFFLCVAMLVACGVTMADNTWFEEGRNFSAYSLGQGKVHVKVLVFARGGTNNHWATTGNGGSFVYAYSSGNTVYALQYEGDNNYNCENDYKGWVKFQVKSGTVIITNSYGGNNSTTYTPSNGWVNLYLSRTGESNTPTYLEFDWYPPTVLDNRSFDLKATVTDTRKYGNTWTHSWYLGSFSGTAFPLCFFLILYPKFRF